MVFVSHLTVARFTLVCTKLVFPAYSDLTSYVATDTRITEYELILRTSLLETCLHHIRANLDKKETFGWNLEALPYDLQFKLNY